MTVSISVRGMNCGNCAASVRRALEKVPGVKSAAVSHETGVASVECGEAVEKSRLVAAVTAAGFEAD